MLSGSGAVSSVLPHRQWASQGTSGQPPPEMLTMRRSRQSTVIFMLAARTMSQCSRRLVWNRDTGSSSTSWALTTCSGSRSAVFRLASTAAWRMSGKTTTMSQPVRICGGGPLTSTSKPCCRSRRSARMTSPVWEKASSPRSERARGPASGADSFLNRPPRRRPREEKRECFEVMRFLKRGGRSRPCMDFFRPDG